MSSAVTPEMAYNGALELLNSGLLRPEVAMDTDAAGLMVAVSRIWMRMNAVAPLGMTREGEWYDPGKPPTTRVWLP